MGVIKGTSTFIGVIPFTELYERLLNLGRIDSPNNRDYAKGIINDSYTRTLPRVEDWQMIVIEDNLQMVNVETAGTASVTVRGNTFELVEGGSTFIPAETVHRLENKSDRALTVVEVQCGDYLGEDDIVRFEDDYGRDDPIENVSLVPGG